jgi:hypothetical protein
MQNREEIWQGGNDKSKNDVLQEGEKISFSKWGGGEKKFPDQNICRPLN